MRVSEDDDSGRVETSVVVGLLLTSFLIALPSFEFALFLEVESTGTCKPLLEDALRVRMASTRSISSDAFGIVDSIGSDGEWVTSCRVRLWSFSNSQYHFAVSTQVLYTAVVR